MIILKMNLQNHTQTKLAKPATRKKELWKLPAKTPKQHFLKQTESIS
jgi:hypothetical protein